MPLYPFIGDGVRTDTREIGLDKSGTKTYKFNSLGFRSEEYNRMALRHVFVCGCSNTFGVGLNAEETWPLHFKTRDAAAVRLARADVNIVNFARPGASNDYIVRTMLMQCAQAKPDMAIAYFTQTDRTEFFSGYSVRPVGRWTVDGASPYDETAATYFKLIDDDPVWRYVTALKNVLLFQEYMRASGIEFLMAWHTLTDLTSGRWSGHPVVAGLEALVDRKRLCPVNLATLKCDEAADGIHAGPRSHLAFAEALADFYKGVTA